MAPAAALLLTLAAAAGAVEPAPVALSTAPLTLERCLELGLARNFELREARGRLARQRAALGRVRSELLPSLDASAEYSRLDPNRLPTFNGVPFGNDESWLASLDLEQPLLAGGAGFAATRRERARLAAARAELDAAEQRTALEVRRGFYAVLLSSAQVAVREGAVALLTEELEAQRRRREVGAVSDFNVLRAEVALANSRTPLIRARNELRLAREDLRKALALPAGEPPETAGELAYQEVPAELEDSLAAARAKRPELVRLRALRDAAGHEVRLRQASYFPELTATASYGVESSRFGSSLSDTDKGWRVGLRGEWNLFGGLGDFSAVREARSERELAELSLERELQEVELEVRRAHSRLEEARELVKASSKVVEQALESLRLARSRFEAGVSTQLDVLDSQVALTEARTNQVQALHQYAVAAAELERAAGAPLLK